MRSNHTFIGLSKLSFNLKQFKLPHFLTGPSSQHLKFCLTKSQKVGYKVESVHLVFKTSSIKTGHLCNLHLKTKKLSDHKHSPGFRCCQRPGSLKKKYGSTAPGSKPQTHQTQMETFLEDQRSSRGLWSQRETGRNDADFKGGARSPALHSGCSRLPSCPPLLSSPTFAGSRSLFSQPRRVMS